MIDDWLHIEMGQRFLIDQEEMINYRCERSDIGKC